MGIDDIKLEKRVLDELKQSEDMENTNSKRAFEIINKGLNKQLKAIKKKEKELEKEKERRSFFSKL